MKYFILFFQLPYTNKKEKTLTQTPCLKLVHHKNKQTRQSSYCCVCVFCLLQCQHCKHGQARGNGAPAQRSSGRKKEPAGTQGHSKNIHLLNSVHLFINYILKYQISLANTGSSSNLPASLIVVVMFFASFNSIVAELEAKPPSLQL